MLLPVARPPGRRHCRRAPRARPLPPPRRSRSRSGGATARMALSARVWLSRRSLCCALPPVTLAAEIPLIIPVTRQTSRSGCWKIYKILFRLIFEFLCFPTTFSCQFMISKIWKSVFILLNLRVGMDSELCGGRRRKQSRRAVPRAWPLILPSKPLIAFWNSLRRDCQMGLKLDSNLNCAA